MRLAFLGITQSHTADYLLRLRAIPDVEWIGMADRDPARGRLIARQAGAHGFDSYAALLAEKPDGVILGTGLARQHLLAAMAAESGAYIFSDLPATREDAQAVSTVCQAHGALWMPAFPLRFSAPVQAIKQVIEAGTLGPILGCTAAHQDQLPDDPLRRARGAIASQLPPVADLLRWFFGCEVTEVYAELNSIFYPGEAFEAETGGIVMLTFANGIFASIDGSWSRPPHSPLHRTLTLEIAGENGLVTLDPFKQALSVYSRSGQPRLSYWGSDLHQAMLNEFTAAIREKRAPAVTGHDALRAVEIVEAAYRSAEVRQPVKISP